MAIFSTDWKMGKCLEWCTQLPLDRRPQTSPVFLIQNVECYFSFCREIVLSIHGSEGYYRVYVKTKALIAQLKSFSFNIYCIYNRTKIINLTECETSFFDTKSHVFSFTEKPFTNKPCNLSVGFPIKFFFAFEYTVGLLLPSEIKTVSDSKGIQTGSYLNAIESVDSLPDDFSKLLETEDNYDAEIKCGEHALKVHKIILSARSEVLKAMLQSDMMEGRTGVIEIQDIDGCYLRDFIHYLYTSSIPELTFDKAKALYEVGDKYHVKSLMLKCSEYLQDILSEDIIFECFSLADAHSDQKLKDAIKMFVISKKLYLYDECWSPFCEKFPVFSTEVYRSLFKRRKTKV